MCVCGWILISDILMCLHSIDILFVNIKLELLHRYFESKMLYIKAAIQRDGKHLRTKKFVSNVKIHVLKVCVQELLKGSISC